jgi:hypothetical protein
MNDNDDDDNVVHIDDSEPMFFSDIVSQRAIAFVTLAHFSETSTDRKTKELTLLMMQKIITSIKTPSTAELKTIN